MADAVTALTDEVRVAPEELGAEPYGEFFSDGFVAYVRGSRVSRSDWREEIRKFMSGLRDISHEPNRFSSRRFVSRTASRGNP